MSENDRIIWDSGHGYEIGYFKGEGVIYDSFLVDLVTGIAQGLCSFSKSEIKPYSNELISELTKKYGYEKKFSEIF